MTMDPGAGPAPPRPVETGAPSAAGVLDVAGLRSLVDVLAGRGYRVVAPVVRDGAVVHEEIRSADELPWGVGDIQSPGRYRLRRRDDELCFGFASPASSWKRFLYPPQTPMWNARLEEGGELVVEEATGPDPVRYAFLGVRACELAAIGVHDRVFLGGRYVDAAYARARGGLVMVAVDCSDPAEVCFCASMGTGPVVGPGADLVLTEIAGEGGHRFLVRTGSAVGEELLGALPVRPPTSADVGAAAAVSEQARARLRRRIDADSVPDLLRRSAAHPRWDEVAERCLSCGNCTMACPTCFCSDLVDADDVTGTVAQRTRQWASCFSLDFSYIHGGTVRRSIASRYRQWLTHKLGTWWDQFGTSGCVGCGRCITWCPVGIDITEEVAALAAPPGGSSAGGTG